MFTGSEPDQMHLIQISSTLMEVAVMNVEKKLAFTRLQRAVSITSLKTSAPLMMGLITVLWPHVERYYLEMELNWNLV